MFPENATTIIESNETNSDILNNSVLPSGNYYILNISVISKDNRLNTVYCGNSPILIQRAGPAVMDIPFNYHCQNTIKADLYRTSSIYFTYKEANPVISTSTTVTVNSMLGSLNMGWKAP